MSRNETALDERLENDVGPIDWSKLSRRDAAEFAQLLGKYNELTLKPAYDHVAYMTTFGGVIGIAVVGAACWLAMLDGYTPLMAVLLAQSMRGVRFYLKHRKGRKAILSLEDGIVDFARQLSRAHPVDDHGHKQPHCCG
jgi:hypothetical protein